jgi:hypothetical protein
MAKRETSAESRSEALPEEGQGNIVVGHVYKEDSSEQEVIPYFVDFAAARVNFAGVGRSNEDQMRTSDFLNRFKYVGPVSSGAEKQVSNEDALKAKEAARVEEQKRVTAAGGAQAPKTGV